MRLQNRADVQRVNICPQAPDVTENLFTLTGCASTARQLEETPPLAACTQHSVDCADATLSTGATALLHGNVYSSAHLQPVLSRGEPPDPVALAARLARPGPSQVAKVDDVCSILSRDVFKSGFVEEALHMVCSAMVSNASIFILAVTVRIHHSLRLEGCSSSPVDLFHDLHCACCSAAAVFRSLWLSSCRCTLCMLRAQNGVAWQRCIAHPATANVAS